MKPRFKLLAFLSVIAVLAFGVSAFAQKGGKKGGKGCTAPPPELTTQPTCLLPGCLDSTFGGGTGRVVSLQGLWINGVAIQTIEQEERIVAVGRTASSCIANSDLWTVARYLPDGTLDESFGNNGVVYEDHGNSDGANAVVVQPDGKIVVAGYGGGYAVARYNQDGSRDLSFGTGGMVTVPEFPTYSGPYAVALQSDGKIVAAGEYYWPRGIAVVRLNADGTLDTGFNGNGQFVYWGSENSSSTAYAITFQTIDNEERIVVAGHADGANFHSPAALLRLTANGTLDSTFGDSGIVATYFTDAINEFESVAVDSSNRLVAAGFAYPPGDTTTSDLALARYNEDGTLDSSFGTGGKVLLSSPAREMARALAIQPDGRILLAGEAQPDDQIYFAVWRFLDNGTLDPGFATKGVATTEFVASRSSGGMSSLLQSGDKLVAVGLTRDSNSYIYGALARYRAGQEVPNHDVAVLSISPSSSGATQGDVLTLEVEVLNLGQSYESADVTLTDSRDGAVLGTQNAPLDPGQSATVTFDWSTALSTEVGEHILLATVTTASDERPENDSASTTVSIALKSSGYDIFLTARGYKDQGRQTVYLSWEGATSVDIYRDAQLIATGANGTSYTDQIGARGGGSYEYQVCGDTPEGEVCSNVETVTF